MGGTWLCCAQVHVRAHGRRYLLGDASRRRDVRDGSDGQEAVDCRVAHRHPGAGVCPGGHASTCGVSAGVLPRRQVRRQCPWCHTRGSVLDNGVRYKRLMAMLLGLRWRAGCLRPSVKTTTTRWVCTTGKTRSSRRRRLVTRTSLWPLPSHRTGTPCVRCERERLGCRSSGLQGGRLSLATIVAMPPLCLAVIAKFCFRLKALL